MKETILVFGSETAFNKRATDLFKRNYNVTELTHKLKFDENGGIIIDLPNLDTMRGHFSLKNVRYFFITSESILFFRSSRDLDKLKLIIELVLTDFPHISPIVVIFNDPNPLDSNLDLYSKETYDYLIFEFQEYCSNSKITYLKFDKYFTHIESDLQVNSLKSRIDNQEFTRELISESDANKGNLADVIIEQILFKLGSDLPLKNIEPSPFDISIYRKIRQKLYNNDDLSFDDTNYSDEKKIAHQKECSVEVLYRKDPSELINSRSIADIRFNLGKELFNIIPKSIISELEYIIPIPETGKFYAQGFSSAAKVAYLEAFFKKIPFGRSFDIADVKDRNNFINSKLALFPGLIENRVIGLMDEAVFTGSTLKIAVHLLKSANVKKIFIFIPSPICSNSCDFNMQPKRAMLSSYIKTEQLMTYFEVSGIYFQELTTYESFMKKTEHACVNCFKNKI